MSPARRQAIALILSRIDGEITYVKQMMLEQLSQHTPADSQLQTDRILFLERRREHFEKLLLQVQHAQS